MSYDLYVDGWHLMETKEVRLVDMYETFTNEEFADDFYDTDSEGFYVEKQTVAPSNCPFLRVWIRMLEQQWGTKVFDEEGVVTIPNKDIPKFIDFLVLADKWGEENILSQCMPVVSTAIAVGKDLYIAG